MKESRQFALPGWAPPPSAGGQRRFFQLGEVRLAVLSLLQDGPNHGYQLMKDLTARLGKLYRVGSGTVYPVLQQLEKERLVECKVEEGRKIYRLTMAGRRVLSSEAKTIREIWSRAEEAEDLGEQWGPHSLAIASPLSELSLAALRAAAWSAGDANREDQVRGVIRRASAELNRMAGSHKERP